MSDTLRVSFPDQYIINVIDKRVCSYPLKRRRRNNIIFLVNQRTYITARQPFSLYQQTAG